MTSYGFKVNNICEGGTNCPTLSPVLQCEIDLGFSFIGASASYTVVALDDSDKLQHPDNTQAMTSWDMAATGHDGYFSFGTPATIIDGGGAPAGLPSHLPHSASIKAGGSTPITFAKGPTAPSTVLRFGFCQSYYEEQFRIKDIAAKIWLPTPGTCSDGVQNQLETNVDCGGPCSACPTFIGWAPTCCGGYWAFRGVQVLQNNIDLLNYGSLAEGANQGKFKWKSGTPVDNGSANGYVQYSDYHGNQNWASYWASTSSSGNPQPTFYMQLTAALDGSQLTAVTTNYDSGHAASAGHIVSATHPDGPWVIRASWSKKNAVQTETFSIP
jgi:hypothetical protein